MNAAWGSDYTSFGSAGGWPRLGTHGTGLLDEDGSSPWVGKGTEGLSKASTNFTLDANAFLARIADQYFRVAATAVKKAYPQHLVFGPGALNTQTYEQVLQKAGQYLDVVEVWTEPRAVNSLNHAYDVAGKPLVVWTTLQSQDDSPMAGNPGWGKNSSVCNSSANYNFTKQELRGKCYHRLIASYLDARGKDGIHPVIGIIWWEWTDKAGEKVNFGLVTNHDNAYDGLEDVVKLGADSWSYPTGGETRDYGDFLSLVTSANVAEPARSLLDSRNGTHR